MTVVSKRNVAINVAASSNVTSTYSDDMKRTIGTNGTKGGTNGTTGTARTTATTGTGPAKEDWSGGAGLLPGREVLGPLFLMAVTPVFAMIVSHVFQHHNGNAVQFAHTVWKEYSDRYDSDTTSIHNHHWTIGQQIRNLWPNPWNWYTWKMIASFLTFELLLMRFVPGKLFIATTTPTGHRPVYKANGMACYLLTLGTLMALDAYEANAHNGYWSTGFRMSHIYDSFGPILSSMNVLAWLFCFVLLIKGYVAPSGLDAGTTGSWINDFYWGMELYPRILGWDVKQFTNCRAGMMFWAVAILSFCYKNMDLNNGRLQYGLAVSVALQLVYISKFFHWEMGYMCSMDIQHDRAGYYICWGCLVWVPAVYTSAAFYLVENGPTLHWFTALMICCAGWVCIWINFDSDRQRYMFRQSNGDCLIWGRPPRYIVASYQTSSGTSTTKTSLLLVDGWWKVSRHFHYVPEIMASFFWSLPALDSGFIGPYFYVIYLTILLTDRAVRDDNRCRAKYGTHWDEYCAVVPYQIVPGVL